MTEKKTATLDLGKLLKPIAEVVVDKNIIYLYPLKVKDITTFSNLPKDDAPVNKIRVLLRLVASTTNESDFKQTKTHLEPDFIDSLSSEDVEKISEAYIASNYTKSYCNKLGDLFPSREANELASTYLNRFLIAHITAEMKDLKGVVNKAQISASSIFEQVKKRSSLLGDALSDYESYNFLKASPSILSNSSDSLIKSQNELFNAQAKQHQKIAKEREDELKKVGLTADMTAQSAMLLKELSDAATTFLEQSEERTKTSNKTTKIQLWIAVGSVIISVIISAISLYLSLLAFNQDRVNNKINDDAQKMLIKSIDENSNKYSALEKQNLNLQEQIIVLQRKVITLSNKEPASKKN